MDLCHFHFHPASAEMRRGFWLYRFCRGFSWRIVLQTFSHKNDDNKSGDKIRRPKHKIGSAKTRSGLNEVSERDF